jgi:hypothetical protein
MRGRNGPSVARLGSERVLKSRQLRDAPTHQVAHTGRTPRASAVAQPQCLPSPSLGFWV